MSTFNVMLISLFLGDTDWSIDCITEFSDYSEVLEKKLT